VFRLATSTPPAAKRAGDPILSSLQQNLATCPWLICPFLSFCQAWLQNSEKRPKHQVWTALCDLANCRRRRHKRTRETRTTVVTSQPELPGVCERKRAPPCCRRCRRGGSALWVSVCPVALTIATQLVTTIEHNAERQHLRFVVRRRT
jgi:hypothetical protein